MLRVFDLSLTGGSVPVDGKPSIGFGVFYFSLARWPLPVVGETSIAFFIFDAPLTSRSFSVLRQTFVVSRIFNASLTPGFYLGTDVTSRFDRLLSHCPKNSNGKGFFQEYR